MDRQKAAARARGTGPCAATGGAFPKAIGDTVLAYGLIKAFFTAGLKRDLQKLDDFVAVHDSVAHAERLLDRLEALVADLATRSDRGAHPRELSALGIQDYRQAFFKPYRVIYRPTGANVIIYLVADGRRDMGTLLARRLLNG